MTASARLLAEARKRTGFSQAALARRAGIPRSVLNAYERGNRQPGGDALAAILAAAGFALALRPKVNVHRNARVLADVLDLAGRLPYKPKKRLAYPPFNKRVG